MVITIETGFLARFFSRAVGLMIVLLYSVKGDFFTQCFFSSYLLLARSLTPTFSTANSPWNSQRNSQRKMRIKDYKYDQVNTCQPIFFLRKKCPCGRSTRERGTSKNKQKICLQTKTCRRSTRERGTLKNEKVFFCEKGPCGRSTRERGTLKNNKSILSEKRAPAGAPAPDRGTQKIPKSMCWAKNHKLLNNRKNSKSEKI